MLYNSLNLLVGKFASKSTMRPALSCVFFTPKLTAATDSFRLLEMSTPSDQNVADYPNTGGAAMRGCEPFLVSAKDVLKIKIVKAKGLPILDHVAVKSVSKERVELMTGDLEVSDVKSMRRITDEFPQYEQIFPKTEALAEVKVNADYLIELCEVLKKLDGAQAITIKMYGKTSPVVLEASNARQSGRAMLMPMNK